MAARYAAGTPQQHDRITIHVVEMKLCNTCDWTGLGIGQNGKKNGYEILQESCYHSSSTLLCWRKVIPTFSILFYILVISKLGRLQFAKMKDYAQKHVCTRYRSNIHGGTTK